MRRVPNNHGRNGHWQSLIIKARTSLSRGGGGDKLRWKGDRSVWPLTDSNFLTGPEPGSRVIWTFALLCLTLRQNMAEIVVGTCAVAPLRRRSCRLRQGTLCSGM